MELPAFEGRCVLVLGDVILDRFLYGHASRLSPEAPVPVVRLARTESMAGGAGNVARNVAALGGQATLLALAGEDAEATELDALLAGAGRLLRDGERRTTVKLRVIADRQQVVRVDDETLRDATPLEAARLAQAMGEALPGTGAVVLSDYGKGVLTPDVLRVAIAAAVAAGVPCFVDPKGRDFARYAGATCLTPNAHELAEATGLPTATDAECEAAARAVLARVSIGALLATRSDRGMMLVPRDGPALAIPAQAREVFDVSGAGDTVIATLALGVAAGLSLPDAMRAANAAAGCVVAKLGTATCSREELVEALHGPSEAAGQLLTREEAVLCVRDWQAQGLKVGFANGCFDVLHAGHVRLLRQARAACDRLVVALNDDASVRRLKGDRRPINELGDRAAVLAGLAAVDAVTAFGEDTPLAAIMALRPDRLFKGADYAISQVVGAVEVASWGGETRLLPLLEGRSTTEMVRRARG